MGDATCTAIELAEQPMVRICYIYYPKWVCFGEDRGIVGVRSFRERKKVLTIISLALQACCFHGTEPLVAVGLVTGQVQAFRLASNGDASTSAPAELFTKKPHKESCRAIGFSLAGNRLYTASADGWAHMRALLCLIVCKVSSDAVYALLPG